MNQPLELLQTKVEMGNVIPFPCMDDCEGRKERQCNCCSSMIGYKNNQKKLRQIELARAKKEIQEARTAREVVIAINNIREQIAESIEDSCA